MGDHITQAPLRPPHRQPAAPARRVSLIDDVERVDSNLCVSLRPLGEEFRREELIALLDEAEHP